MRAQFLRKPKESGQILFLVLLMTMTLVSVMTFAVHTGLLVHAKINVQNAADLAAYTGASVQARQLTYIGYLNYEMRRQYKKFLYRYYVIGHSQQSSHPQSNAPGVRDYFVLDEANRPVSLDVPSACYSDQRGSNMCRPRRIPRIGIPNPSPLMMNDALSSTTLTALDRIEQIKQKGCLGVGRTNYELMQAWLFNTDPDHRLIQQELENTTDEEFRRNYARIQTAAQGLGVFPRNLLLNQRIKTLAQYVNYPSKQNQKIADINALKSDRINWPGNERTVSAFLSAYSTLGSHMFSANDVTLTELMPSGNLLELEDIRTDLLVFYTDFALDRETGRDPCYEVSNAPVNTPVDCVMCVSPLKLASSATSNTQLLLGVYKKPTTLTYYALKLEAEVKLPLSPYSQPLKLVAVSAARPFGSRIGPKLDLKDYGWLYNTTILSNSGAVGNRCNDPGATNQCKGVIPNLPVVDGDTPVSGVNGWNEKSLVWHFWNALGSTGGDGPPGPLPSVLAPFHFDRAYQVAMAPNPWEVGQYIFPNDSSPSDPYLQHFGQDGDPANSLFPIWAPLVPPDNSGRTAVDILRELLDQALPPTAAGGDVGLSQVMRQGLINGIISYANTKLAANMGEDFEGLNVVRLRDPTRNFNNGQPPTRGQNPIEGPPPTLLALAREDVRTSWKNTRSPEVTAAGRNGYSVKFVPFRDLKSGSLVHSKDKSGTRSTGFVNRITDLLTGPGDLDQIQH